MSKKLTFTAPLEATYQPPAAVQATVKAIVSRRVFETNAAGETTVNVAVAVINAAGDVVSQLGPFKAPLPPSWQEEIDMMDAKILNYVKNQQAEYDGLVEDE